MATMNILCPCSVTFEWVIRVASYDPQVSIRTIDRFNDMVGMDILFFEDLLFLHLVDYMSRLGSVSEIPNREMGTILLAIDECWTRFFSLPSHDETR